MTSLLQRVIYSSYARGLRLARRVGFAGTRFHCPFCRGNFRRMVPGGSREAVWTHDDIHPGGWREHLYCPQCYSTDKERFAWLMLKSRLSKDARVLHIAPEPHLGACLQEMCGSYISGDITPGRAMRVVDITNAAFPDASFDIVICSQVMEHIDYDRRAMREIYRILASGGWAYLPTPISDARTVTFEDPAIISPRAREERFGQADHVRMYAWDYLDRLRGAGFIVHAGRASEFIPDWERYALDPRDVSVVAEKSVILSAI